MDLRNQMVNLSYCLIVFDFLFYMDIHEDDHDVDSAFITQYTKRQVATRFIKNNVVKRYF